MLGAMIKAITEVRKILTLEFQLPGVEPSWSSSGGQFEKQLEQRTQERWSIKVSQSSALETARVLEEVATAIRKAMASA